MKTKSFKELAIEHLSQINDNEGWYNYKGRYVIHKHILKLSEACKTDRKQFKTEQQRVIIEKNLLPAAKERRFILESVHTDAHHLNSSQIMCYNFFRPLMSDNKKPCDSLISLFKKFCPEIKSSTDSICEFEYEPDNKERTNYDFFLSSGGVRILCEIKYTEENFAKKSQASSNTWDKRIEMYQKVIKDFPEIWHNPLPSAENMVSNHYQLFRNAISVKSDKDYVFFICPEGREDLMKAFYDFSINLSKYGKEHIQHVTWETLLDMIGDGFPDNMAFREKYLLI